MSTPPVPCCPYCETEFYACETDERGFCISMPYIIVDGDWEFERHVGGEGWFARHIPSGGALLYIDQTTARNEVAAGRALARIANQLPKAA